MAVPVNPIVTSGDTVYGQITTGTYQYAATALFTKINNLRLTPTSNASISISILPAGGGTPIPIDPIGLSVAANTTFYDDNIALNLNDILQIVTTQTTNIYFYITPS